MPNVDVACRNRAEKYAKMRETGEMILYCGQWRTPASVAKARAYRREYEKHHRTPEYLARKTAKRRAKRAALREQGLATSGKPFTSHYKDPQAFSIQMSELKGVHPVDCVCYDCNFVRLKWEVPYVPRVCRKLG